MVRPFVRSLLLASVAAAALIAMPAVADGQAGGEIEQSQRRLDQIRAEREQLRREMSTLRSRVHTVEGELENLERQAAASAELLEEIEFQLAAVEEEIDGTIASLAVAQDRLGESRAVLSWRLRDVYKRGPLQEVQVLLSAASFSDLLNRYKYLYLLTRRDQSLVNEVERLERELRNRERVLAHQRRRVEALQRERIEERRELERMEWEQLRALAALQTREQTARGRIQDLERDERRLTASIEEMERRRREAERAAARRGDAVTAEAATVTTADMGSLAWPVEGAILYRFGRATQSGGTTVRRNGIGIGADRGTPVRAVARGTVAHAGPFEGYGQSVFVSHGGGYYSLYLHLGAVRVREGDAITDRQVVGTVGTSGREGRPHIEFQIRAPGGSAVDPLQWLQGQR